MNRLFGPQGELIEMPSALERFRELWKKTERRELLKVLGPRLFFRAAKALNLPKR